MGLGESAGRSARNRTAVNAKRRNTQRERAGIDPPFAPEPKPQPRYRLTPRGVMVRDALLALVAYGSFIAFCCLGAIIIAAWWGLI